MMTMTSKQVLHKNLLNLMQCTTRRYSFVALRGQDPASEALAARKTVLAKDPQFAAFLAAAASIESLPAIERNPPEVIVTGRANVGKSTLLNRILGRTNLCRTSKQAGRTQTLNFYRVGRPPGVAVLVDAPGYGHRGRPEWGKIFDHYVQNRQQLKRIFILINPKHGLMQSDRQMLEHLNKLCEKSAFTDRPISFQAIFTKGDRIKLDYQRIVSTLERELFEVAPLCLPQIVTACSQHMDVNVERVRHSIVDACGLGDVSLKP